MASAGFLQGTSGSSVAAVHGLTCMPNRAGAAHARGGGVRAGAGEKPDYEAGLPVRARGAS